MLQREVLSRYMTLLLEIVPSFLLICWCSSN